jgi:hypothetical protein
VHLLHDNTRLAANRELDPKLVIIEGEIGTGSQTTIDKSAANGGPEPFGPNRHGSAFNDAAVAAGQRRPSDAMSLCDAGQAGRIKGQLLAGSWSPNDFRVRSNGLWQTREQIA